MKNKAAYMQIQNNLISTDLLLLETKRNLKELRVLLSTYMGKDSKYQNALWNYRDMKASYKTLRKIKSITYRRIFVLKLRELIK